MYSILSCPILFHDLVEIGDFLMNLSPRYLYMFDGAFIALFGKPVLRVRIFYSDVLYHIVVQQVRLKH